MITRSLRAACAAIAAAALALGTGVGAANAQSSPTPDKLIVSQVGTTGQTLDDVATAGALVHLGSDGTIGASIALPSVASGSQRPITFSGADPQVGTLHQSVDHSVVAIAGFGTALGVKKPQNDKSSKPTPRTIATLDASDAVDSSTSLGAAFAGSHVRGVATVDGSRFWVGGKGNDGVPQAGVVTVAKGASAADAVSADSAGVYNNARVPVIAGGALYVGSDRSGYAGIDRVSATLPTAAVTAAPTVIAAPPSSTTSPSTPQDYAFVGDALYVAYTEGRRASSSTSP